MRATWTTNADVADQIFRRSTKGVVLTPDGEIVRGYAERVLAVIRDLERALSCGPEPGGIRIGLLEDVAESGLAEVLADYSTLHPTVELDVTTACGDVLREAIEGGRFDLVIAAPRLFSAEPHGIRQREAIPLVWAGSPRFDAAARPLPLVLYQAPSEWRDVVVDTLAAAGITWRIAFEASSLATLQAALRAGLGLGAVLPCAVPSGCVAFQNTTGLPDPPQIELSLFRRPELPGTADLVRLERLLWNTLGSREIAG